jgi:general bacterial porin, GBP family
LRKILSAAVAASLCTWSAVACADDSSVTLYGILDEAIANIAHALSFDGNHPVANNPTVTKGTKSATGILNGGLSQTRWGIRGQEDLGGGTRAVFTLESAFNLGSGNLSNAAYGLAHNTSTGPSMSADSAISGQLFARGANVGLSSSNLGTLTAGRHQSFFLDNIAEFDPMLGSQAFSPLGFSGTYGGGGYTDDSRVDNSLKYKLPIGDFTLGLLYKFGGIAGNSTAQNAYQVNGVYASGPLAVEVGYEQFKDAFAIGNSAFTTAVPIGYVAVTAADTKSFMAAVRYKLDQTTLRGGFEREEFNNPSNPTLDQGVTFLFGQNVASVKVTAFPNQKTLNVFWAGATQEFSSAWLGSIAAYHVAQNSFDCPSSTASGCSGSLNYYSLLVDYRMSKRTDLYGGLMISTVSGGPANAVANSASSGLPSETSNRIIAVGMRHRF